ncbi:acetyl-CoA C-acetyltransferase [Priestia filamentosa]|uniref:acetyl-CoA C-acetyltransferase n=1 Tax=Priestia filamentosa TaxID=1402861 RepID=A0A0H4L270_9BACI|nr:acetyl-CoA C-acetyltransferase [Priestia filamentosa]AKO94808.1 acetyl-CoA acetyltransferase [Priestia filamentosa]MDT3765142.1 acetyl-CoA C-acetyltransferase [Priestia filamentosa]OXS65723.1 acetyl-CoA acetyltransferase [Priestia filamentosa]RJS66070.1 acetyl-CoA acetyltransferase [Priestia filamentosa]WRU97689.1 acetyl-CoA C-acetyltransferase [Priestia filamentosa]
MMKSVIVAAKRTPFGRLGGHFRDLTASDLGGETIRALLEEKKEAKEVIDTVLLGNVLQGGQGQLPSRQASFKGGLDWNVKTETINKVCASGMRAVIEGDFLIRLGESEAVIAGGMESMSNAPYFLEQARFGHKMGNQSLKDLMMHDGLTCTFTGAAMGSYGDAAAEEFQLTREEQDEWAVRSHERAALFYEKGYSKEEIVPVQVKNSKGSLFIEEDESLRRNTTAEKLKKLRPAFNDGGTITAGNAPGVNDGSASLVLMSQKKAYELGYRPLATIVDYTSLALQPKDFPKTPGLAIRKLLAKTGKKVEDISLFEINEAFAAVALINMKTEGLQASKVNVNGGALAFGHPIGASGARILVTLIHELQRMGGGFGIASICSGGGQGDAIMIKV